jgi:hypothetical protein
MSRAVSCNEKSSELFDQTTDLQNETAPDYPGRLRFVRWISAYGLAGTTSGGGVVVGGVAAGGVVGGGGVMTPPSINSGPLGFSRVSKVCMLGRNLNICDPS